LAWWVAGKETAAMARRVKYSRDLRRRSVEEVLLDGDNLAIRFECDGVVYGGTAAKTAPVVGEWMTLVTVGLHGRGLFVALAGGRQITIENITEDADGVG
jgi:hypothetical protein